MAYSQIKAILRSSESESLKGNLVRAATGSLGLQVVLTGLSLATNVLLARWLGVSEYGVYSYAVTWLGLLALPSRLGLDKLLVRQVSIYQAQSNWPELRGILRFSFSVVLPFSILLVGSVLTVARILPAPAALPLFLVLAIILLQLPFSSLTGLANSALRGFNKILLGQITTSFIGPALFLVLVGLAAVVFKVESNASVAAWLALLKSAVIFLLAMVWFLRSRPPEVKVATPIYEQRIWMAAAMPMLIISVMGSMTGRIDVLILGSIQGTEAVGVYNVAFRGVQLIAFGLLAINFAIGPTVAKLYANQEMIRLQKLMTQSARMILMYTILVATGFIIFGSWYLRLFGPGFLVGYGVLIILSIGRIFSATMGSAGLLLTMTGHERNVLASLLAGVCINVLLDLLLIPRFGINGAAVASVSGLILLNILVAVRAYQLLGIHTTALGKIGRTA